MTKQAKPEGIVQSLFIKTEHGAPMTRSRSLDAVGRKGIVGDQAYGRRSRQVLIVELDKLQALKLEPGELRENITVSGLPIDSLPVGSRLQSGEVILKIVAVCDPCSKLEKIRPGLMEASENMRGMLAIVEQGGTLREGERIGVVKPGDIDL